MNVMCRAVKRHSIHCTGRDSLCISFGEMWEMGAKMAQMSRMTELVIMYLASLFYGSFEGGAQARGILRFYEDFRSDINYIH